MTQDDALTILKTGANVFLTGEPGAGKTYVLNQYTSWLQASNIAVAITASTGIAATHIGGLTIHSWSGVGARDTLSERDLDFILQNEKLVARIKKAKVLVIDEISMLDGRVLDMVEKILRSARAQGDPFGGLQTIVVGDFFQLPPIAGRGEMARFAFESNAWERARFVTCYLTEQHRQEDEMLLGILSSIRRDDVDESHYTLLNEQTDIAYPDIEPTRLFTHNSDVDLLNSERLRELKTEKRVYKMEGKGNKQLTAGLVKNCLSPQVLELRVDAMVMCTKNNFDAGYVNGTLGRVVSFDPFDQFPIIETADGKHIKISEGSWGVYDEKKVLAEITQVPLRLAWAITVHKSQGMSLDAAEIDLRNAFTYGQGYVALSRVRSLQGMKILGLNANALKVDPRVVSKDERFRIESEDAEDAFHEMDDEEIEKMQRNFVRAVGGTWFEGNIQGGEKPPFEEKQSTQSKTKELVTKGLSVAQIAKERSMAQSTIWSHIETLANQNELDADDLEKLIPASIAWETAYPLIEKTFQEHGTEKLKPAFEALHEEYSYDILRLARLFFLQNVCHEKENLVF